jgi:hypothetical protein
MAVYLHALATAITPKVLIGVLLYLMMMMGCVKFEEKKKIWWVDLVLEAREGA